MVLGYAGLPLADPCAPKLRLEDGVLKSQGLAPGALRCFDCLVVTNHVSYDCDLIARESALVVDCRKAIRKPAANVVKP